MQALQPETPGAGSIGSSCQIATNAMVDDV